MFCFTFITQAFSIQSYCPCQLENPSAEMPAVWRENPRPTKHLSSFYCFNNDWSMLCSKYFERHFALTNEIELRCLFSFMEYVCSSVKMNIRGTTGNEL